jgi:hypothetical protein
MNRIRDEKLTRVISTKITDEEYNLLHRLARNYKLRGYIGKASTSEISRLILRVYIEWAFSHTSDQTAMNHTMAQSNENKSSNSTVTMLGSNPTNRRDGSTDGTSQVPSQSSNIPSSNTSLIGIAQQLSDLLCKIHSNYDDFYYYGY